jgi:hypothetical protein
MVSWEIEGTDQFVAWYRILDDDEIDSIDAVVEMLGEEGPNLGRPHADTLEASSLPNLKELRPPGAGKFLRILFVFDPRRQAILLLGGNKEGNWTKWYKTSIPAAEQLYEQYISELEAEGLITTDQDPDLKG